MENNKKSYDEILKGDFYEFISFRLHPVDNEEYIKHEAEMINELKVLLDDNANKKIDVDDIFDIINDYIIFIEYYSYKTGCKDIIHLID